MNPIKIIIALSFALGFAAQSTSAQNINYQFPSPDGYQHTENWLTTWQQFSGTQEQSQWLMEQTADPSSQLFADQGGKNILILQTMEWKSEQELADEIGEGPDMPSASLQTMSQEADLQSLAQGVMLSEWNVELGQTPARVYMAGFRLADGTGMRVLMINQPGQKSDFGNDTGAEAAFTLINNYADKMEPTFAQR